MSRGNEDFDVTVGNNDEVEISELLGLLMLGIQYIYFKITLLGYVEMMVQVCLVVKHLSGPETERLRKNVVKTFKDCGLSIRSKTNLKIVDYLDVTFDLQNNSYKLYRRPDNLPVYI